MRVKLINTANNGTTVLRSLSFSGVSKGESDINAGTALHERVRTYKALKGNQLMRGFCS